jgi:sirohydrochlorin ferrochelatase
MRAVLVISHGSRYPKTKEELTALVAQLKKRTSIPLIKCAFLELESPDIPKGISACVDDGADRILILLNFLNSGKHVDEDIPAIIAQARKQYPKVKFSISQPLGLHKGIVELFADIIDENK